MKFVTLKDGSGTSSVGRLIGDKVHVLHGVPSILSLLGDDGETLHRAGETAERDPARVLPLASAKLAPVVPQPPSIRDFYAFEQHVKAGRKSRGLDMIAEWYEIPVFYFTNPSSLAGDGDTLPFRPAAKRWISRWRSPPWLGDVHRTLALPKRAATLSATRFSTTGAHAICSGRKCWLASGPPRARTSARAWVPISSPPTRSESKRKAKAFDLAITASVNGRQYSTRQFLEHLLVVRGDAVVRLAGNHSHGRRRAWFRHLRHRLHLGTLAHAWRGQISLAETRR